MTESADRQSLRVAVHVKLAFVTLSLNQPERCLMFVEKLRLLSIADNHMALAAAMYEAEALCLLDRSQEATERLRAFVETFASADFSTQRPTAFTDPMRCVDRHTPSAPDVFVCADTAIAQKLMYQNLASVYCASMDLANAKSSVQKALLIDPRCKKVEISFRNRPMRTGVCYSHPCC